MKWKCTTLLTPAAIAAVGLTGSAFGQLVDQPIEIGTVGPLGGGASQLVAEEVEPNENPVIGFAFEGNVSGIGASDAWASDMRLDITAPDGSSYSIGGYDNVVDSWSFEGAGSSDDGFYEDIRLNVFDSIDKGGTWTFEFTNDWGASPANMLWEDVVVTLIKGEPEPVECPEGGPGCPQDLTGNGNVGVGDLLNLLAAWGPCPGCPQDLTGNGAVGVGDLLNLLAAWGPCPPGDPVFDSPSACVDGQDVNDQPDGGCNMNEPAFTGITCGDTYCGTIWATGGTRKLDWYSITITERTTLTWTVSAEFPALAFIRNADCDAETVVAASASSPAGFFDIEVEICLDAGEYYLAVTTNDLFDGMPCDGTGDFGNDYVASLQCDSACVTGACCVEGVDECLDDVTAFTCLLDGGLYSGDGTLCDDPDVCPTGACCLVDISDCADEVTELNCTADGGEWAGAGTLCDDPDVCPVGACCQVNEQGDGVCVADLSINQCFAEGGAYQGDDSECGDVTCPDCPQGSFTKPGACLDNPYGGCGGATDSPVFGRLCCGDQVTGSMRAEVNPDDPNSFPRATDWYVIEIDVTTRLLLTLDHNYAASGLFGGLGIFTGEPCGDFTILEFEGGLPSGGQVVISELPPGTYMIWTSVTNGAGGFPETAMPCGSPNQGQYTLTVSCVEVEFGLCEGNCNNFVVAPGYPGGLCWCDEECEFNTPDGLQCCPGMCDDCAAFEFENCATAECQYDTGASNNAFGWGGDEPFGVVGWAHRFTEDCVEDGIITNIASTFGTGAFPGSSNVSAGQPLGYAVLRSDGGALGEVIWQGQSTVQAGSIESNNFQELAVPNIDITGEGEFFVLVWVWVEFVPGTTGFPAPMDSTQAGTQPAGTVLLVGGVDVPDFGSFDPDDPNAIADGGATGVWMLRVNN
jgi:hypothetical protein